MVNISRRQFVKGSLTASAAAIMGTGFYARGVEPNTLRTTFYDLPTAKWPAGAPPLHVAIATDFHVGCPSVGVDRVGEIVTTLNALKPDIILLLGDFLTINYKDTPAYVAPQPIARALRNLNAPCGVHAVLGNHDWECDGEGMRRALTDNDIKVFENNALHIRHLKHDFWLAGLADDTTRRVDIPATMAQIKGNAPVIMMTHDPAPFLEMPARPAVTVAGHTHGGQVAVPFIRAPLSGRAPRRFTYGHIAEDNRDLIVSSGIGTSRHPVRLGAPPEIVSLTIRAPGP